jgi:hypothetical protein
MKAKLIKDLELSSGKIVKAGKFITTEVNNENILEVTKNYFNELQQQGYFKAKKNIINQ